MDRGSGRPFAFRTVIKSSKLTDYLLKPLPIDDKSGFFLGYGFDVDTLHAALHAHAVAHPVESVRTDEYGSRFEIVGPMPPPDGRIPMVKTIWMVDAVPSTGPARFITAMPA